MRLVLLFLLLPFFAASQCDTVNSVSVTSITSGGASVNFTTPGESVYFVVVYTDGVTTRRLNVNNPGTPYPHLVSAPLTGLSQTTGYNVRIVRYCTLIDSSTTSNYAFTTTVGNCDTVTNIIISTTSSTALITTSEATYGITYRLQYVKAGYTDTVKVTGSTADFSLIGLRPGSNYYYAIKTVCSTDSNSTSFKTFLTRNSPAYTPLTTYGAQFERLLSIKTLNYPAINGEPPVTIDGKNDYPAMKQDTTNEINYYFNPRTQKYFTEGVDVVQDIPALKAHKLTPNRIFVKDSLRGGNFTLIYNTSATEDGGVYFKADSLSDGYFWVRDITNAKALNLLWWGAKGTGINNYKLDSAALENSIAFIGRRGGGSLYIPKCDSFFAYTGNGILLPDNIEIFGDNAAQSHIRYINPGTVVSGYKGVIFFPSTYGPTNTISVFHAPAYNIHDAAKGDSVVILDNIADTIHFTAGKVIFLGGNKFNKDGDATKFRYWQNELNEVSKTGHDTVYLNYALSDSFTTDLTSGSPVIRDVNSGTTTATTGNFTPLSLKDHISKNVHIHDLKLSQSMVNELSGAAFSGVIASVIQLGGTFNSRFENLFIDGATGINGNMWVRTVWNNIKLTVARNVIDMGYATSNSTFTNIHYQYKGSPVIETAPTFIFFNESSHDCEISNITASGKAISTNVLTVGNGAHNLVMHDVNVDFRNTSNDNFGINISDADTAYTHDILIYNSSILMDTIGRWIRFSGNRTFTGNNAAYKRNIVLKNITFTGQISHAYTDGFFINQINGIQFNNVYVPSGDTIKITNSDSSIFREILAPTLYISLSNSDGILENCTFAESVKTNYILNNKGFFVNGGSDAAYFGRNVALTASGAVGNASFGNSSLAALTNGAHNAVLGYKGLNAATTASENVSVGRNSLLLNIDGTDNVALGDQALNKNTNGSKNIGVGSLAGYNSVTGINSLHIGFRAAALPYNYSNALNIKNILFGFGLTQQDSVISTGNLSVGVLDSTARFVLPASTANYPSFRLKGASSDPSSNVNAGAMWYNSTANAFKGVWNATVRTFATLDGTEALTNKTIAAGSNTITGLSNAALSYAANSILVNTTAGTTTPTALTFKQVAMTSYTTEAASAVWDGTPPSTVNNATYEYTQLGTKTTLHLILHYNSAGAANTTVTLLMPSGAPTPAEESPLTAANNVMYFGSGGFTTGVSGNLPNNSKVSINVNSTDTGYVIVVSETSTAARTVNITITYTSL